MSKGCREGICRLALGLEGEGTPWEKKDELAGPGAEEFQDGQPI